VQIVSALLLIILALAAVAWMWRRGVRHAARPFFPAAVRFPADWWPSPAEPGVRVLQRITVSPGAVLLYLELPDGRRLLVAVGAPATVIADGSAVPGSPRERREDDAPSGDGMR
jgi:hypothetical protein